MSEGRCCNRVLLDAGYMGAHYFEHERHDSHDWLDDGSFCCLNWPPKYKSQICWCRGRRWTLLREVEAETTPVAKPAADDLAEAAVTVGDLTRGELPAPAQ